MAKPPIFSSNVPLCMWKRTKRKGKAQAMRDMETRWCHGVHSSKESTQPMKPSFSSSNGRWWRYRHRGRQIPSTTNLYTIRGRHLKAKLILISTLYFLSDMDMQLFFFQMQSIICMLDQLRCLLAWLMTTVCSSAVLRISSYLRIKRRFYLLFRDKSTLL
jgi:hypothetical protein